MVVPLDAAPTPQGGASLTGGFDPDQGHVRDEMRRLQAKRDTVRCRSVGGRP